MKVNREEKPLVFVAALLLTAIGGCRILHPCGDQVFDDLGHFSSKESGLRASIKKLSQQIKECPNASKYVVGWKALAEDGVVQQRETAYDRRTRQLCYEMDPGSGCYGDVYVVDDAAVHAVAAKNGLLDDFAPYDAAKK